ncbi:hypothetical protein M0R04_08355 [Candidatus Dojkabacteria bacterium]|jgi:hypothetical protein|nr:hypothetical protein [Candidatus Dojkabacteria bacterium]
MQDFELELDEFDDDDLFDISDYEETPITLEQKNYALSLVGLWCKTKSEHGLTPFLDNLLCKVMAVNDTKKGGNPSQVQVLVYRNAHRFVPRTWMCIPNIRTYEIVDSSWLIPTDLRPTIKDYALSVFSINARKVFSSIGNEQTGFKYQWWKHSGMWQYLAPINSMIAALYDTGLAFKYGVYLADCKNNF